jgi:uncharacterized protein (DUF58 family)
VWPLQRASPPPAEPTPRPDRSRPELPADLARKVRRIEISTNRLVDQGVAGEYHSVFKGRGMEFAEVRPYQPGDDVRTIDWNVTARMGQPFLKRMVEERDLTVFLAVDISGSLGFGSRAILKRELAAEIAALLAFAALRNRDRVGAALISDRTQLFLAPQRRRNHVLRLVREILTAKAGGATDLDTALLSLLPSLKKRAVVFLISDFVEARAAKALERATARHDVVAVEILDPLDDEIPAGGPVLLRDAETGIVTLAGGVRQAARHGELRRAERQAVRQILKRLGVDVLTLRTDQPYFPPLVSFFEKRRKRLAR